MAEIFDFNLTSKQYLHLAIDRHRKGDSTTAAVYARSAIKADKKNISAYLVLAVIYADDREYELSNQVLYYGIHECKAWNNSQVRRGLTLNFMHMDMFDVALHYTTESNDDLNEIIESELDADFEDFDDSEFHLVYPRTDEYYGRLIGKAIELAECDEIDEALKILESIPSSTLCKAQADRAMVMICTMDGNTDRALELGERLLEKNPDNVKLRSTVAGILLMRNEYEAAKKVADRIWDNEIDDLEEALTLVPVAARLDFHDRIVQLIDVVIKKDDTPPKEMLHLFSQALYNIGERDEARRVMADLRDYFGEYGNAKYFLELFASEPDKVSYGFDIPEDRKKILLKNVNDMMSLSDSELIEFSKKHTDDCDNMDYYFKTALTSGDVNLICRAIVRMQYAEKIGDGAIRHCLVTDGLSYRVLSALMFALMDMNTYEDTVEFDIVVQDKYKRVRINMPMTYGFLPRTLLNGIRFAYSDIIFSEDEPNEFLDMLTDIIDDIMILNDDCTLGFSKKRFEKLRGIRDSAAFAGALIYRIFIDEVDEYEDIIERRGVNARLFKKYYKIMFGADDE